MLDTTNVVQVASIQESRITHVSLYSGLAEITRVYKVKLKAGDNKVVISELPNKLVQDSVRSVFCHEMYTASSDFENNWNRVEGRGGPCTIHEVAISQAGPPVVEATTKSTPKLTDLRKQKSRVQRALDRKKKAIKAISSFYNSLTVNHVDAVELVKTTKQLESVHAELDEKLMSLEEELRVLQQEIKDERGTVKDDTYRQLGRCASITIAAETEADVEIVLVYGTCDSKSHVVFFFLKKNLIL